MAFRTHCGELLICSSQQTAKLHPGDGRSQGRISTQEWKKHKGQIAELYLQENQPLREVMRQMELKCGFHASERQYKHQLSKWKIEKNLTSKQLAAMVRIQDERTQKGKQTRITLREKPVPQGKIERWQKRMRPDAELENEDVFTPGELRVETPSPTISSQSDHEDDQPDLPTRSSTSRLSMRREDETMVSTPNTEHTEMTPQPADPVDRHTLTKSWVDEQDLDTVKIEEPDEKAPTPKAGKSSSLPLPEDKKSRPKRSIKDCEMSATEDDTEVLDGKKTKANTDGLNMACPFRKKNPRKFNVRDHRACALSSFDSHSALKRHIKNLHRQKNRAERPNACFRCGIGFESQAELNGHLRRPIAELCSVVDLDSPSNPEDGISAEMDALLTERRHNTKLDSWQGIFKKLFPGFEPIPSPEFQPPIEMDEVGTFFQSGGSIHQLIGDLQILAGDTDAPMTETMTRSLTEVVKVSVRNKLASSRRQNGWSSQPQSLASDSGLPGHEPRQDLFHVGVKAPDVVHDFEGSHDQALACPSRAQPDGTNCSQGQPDSMEVSPALPMTPFSGADPTLDSIGGVFASYPEITHDMEGLFGLGLPVNSPFTFESPDDFVFAGGCGNKESSEEIDFAFAMMQPEINLSDNTLTGLPPFDCQDTVEPLNQPHMPPL